MLHDLGENGGLGFCNDALSLLPPKYHGPLIMALDSNILIDLRQHGSALLNGDQITGLDAGYEEDLDGLARILDLWMVRDIRFIVTPRSLTDARKRTERFRVSQAPAVEAIAESLAFQVGNWDEAVNMSPPPCSSIGEEKGLPSGADRDLVLEAQAIGAHIFLTRDKRILTKTQLSGPKVGIMAPAAVAENFKSANVEIFSGGICALSDCPYTTWPLPFPDTGKWGPLLSIFS
ncbi:hypothetical protein [Arthrobacter sp. NPDC092385]|uniref:hypothetical protein n=1 Tax=Arthrobacter sp. NPDC092385 TaxID=3363943 RepID=UPI003804E78E